MTRALRTAAAACAALALSGAAGGGDVRIDGTSLFPESLSADAAGRLYVGSVQGMVYRSEPNGEVATAWIMPTAENGLLALLGILVDERRKTLWVCTTPSPFAPPPATPATAAVVAFELATGRLKARYPLPAAGGCNDMAIARDGALYVTDPGGGRVLLLPAGGATIGPFAEAPALRGVDGIAIAGDGTIYVNNIQKNQLLRVDRRPDGAFADLTVLATSQPLKGPDGLRPIGGNRFLQTEGGGGRVTLVTIRGDMADIRTLRDGLDAPSGVTPARGWVYAIEGKIGYLIDPKLKGQSPGAFYARAIPLKPR